MNTDKIFKRIWNINGLILLLGSISFIAILSYQLTKSIFKDDYRQQQTLDLADDVADEEKWSLGYPQEIHGSEYYFIPLESENRKVEEKSKVLNLYSSNYIPTRSKNILFISSISNTSHWLFDSVQQLIIQIQTLDSDDNIKLNTKAIYYIVVNSDTNNDGIFDSEDKRTFALTKPDGSNYSEIITGYDSIVKAHINEIGNLFVIYINNDKVQSMIVDLTDFKIIDSKQLPRVSDS
jgi:hypothetical protein